MDPRFSSPYRPNHGSVGCYPILRFCGENPNSDGSMPTQRIKALWDGLYGGEYTERVWDGCNRAHGGDYAAFLEPLFPEPS